MNLRARVEKIESAPAFAARLIPYDGSARLSCDPYDDECPLCKAHYYSSVAVVQWEQERGLYVRPGHEDIMLITCQHCGGERDNRERAKKQDERAALRREIECQDAIDARIDGVCELAEKLVTAALIASGYHQHKRQWRKKS